MHIDVFVLPTILPFAMRIETEQYLERVYTGMQ